MTLFIAAAALLGLFAGSVLASWIDRLPYEDIETSVRLPSLGSRAFIWAQRRSSRAGAALRMAGARTAPGRGLLRCAPLSKLPGPARRASRRAPWLARRQTYLERNRFLEEDYQRLPWYKRLPIVSLFFDSSPIELKWYDKLPLAPYFIYAVKFSNYRALKPRALCHRCGHDFGVQVWLPLAWIFKDRMQCPRCGGRLSALRPAIEAVTAALFAVFAARFGPTWLLAGYLVLLAAFVVCAAVDWQFQIIPDEINTAGLALGFAYCAATHAAFSLGWISDSTLGPWAPADYDRWYYHITVLDSAAGFLAGAGALLALGRIGTWIAGTDALGGGDIKLAGFIGAFLGWRYVLVSLFYSALLGAVAGGFVLWLGRGGQKEHGFTKFAFGPYICMGTVLVMYFGAETMFYSYMGFNNWLTSKLAKWLSPAAF